MSATASVPPILVLQHIGCEPAAAYEDELNCRGLPQHRIRLDKGEDLPDWRTYAGIVVMGGPMGVYDEAGYPWLATEKRFIAEAVLAGKPYRGVCLGAQLLAASLGAGVATGRMPEVGVLSVELTANAARDPVFAGAPASFKAFQWHSDTYELPDGTIRLAGSAQYEQQAFVFARAYALQFHLEVTPALVAEWVHVSAYANSLDRLSAGVDRIALLITQLASAAPYTTALARELFWAMANAHCVRLSNCRNINGNGSRSGPCRGRSGKHRRCVLRRYKDGRL